jgi:hypothetical protein
MGGFFLPVGQSLSVNTGVVLMNADDKNWARDLLLQALPRQSVGAEIGVYKGDFAQKILDVVQPKQLHLIDPWVYQESSDYDRSWYGGQAGRSQSFMDDIYQSVCLRFSRGIDSGAVRVHRDTSDSALGGMADASLDWVYIDGNHKYEYVKRDLELGFKKVKGGGLVAGDDYGVAGWWEDGVTRAVNEYVASGACLVVFIQESQFILKKTTP